MKLYCGAVAMAALFIFSVPVSAQHYYAVIGAYATADKAEIFTNYAQSKNFEASFLKNSETSLYYVFVLQANDKDKAFTYVRWLQKNTEFTDAWVYYGQLREIEPPFVEADPSDTTQKALLAESEKEQNAEVEMDIDINYDVITPDASPDPLVLEDTEEKLPRPRGKYFRFDIISPEGALLTEQIHHVDFTRGVEIGSYKSNKYVDLLRPRNRKNDITLVCGIFGYQEIVMNIDYNNPSEIEGAYQDDKGVWVIPFYLQPLQRGDASLMYNLAFYKDAVVMVPQSKSDLDKLVTMMQENPRYAIKVHGHCNGGHKRKIIALGDNMNYFDIAGADELNGSARDLTMLRAQTIRSYLIDNGVESNRISIRPWGGKDMLVNKDGPSSKLNDRIEIEILKD